MAEIRRHGIEEVVCREFVELVTDYWEGALPEDRVALVEEHLVMCDWCKVYLDQMETTVQVMGDAREVEAPFPETQHALLSAFREWTEQR